jgi:hypothetical protein
MGLHSSYQCYAAATLGTPLALSCIGCRADFHLMHMQPNFHLHLMQNAATDFNQINLRLVRLQLMLTCTCS